MNVSQGKVNQMIIGGSASLQIVRYSDVRTNDYNFGDFNFLGVSCFLDESQVLQCKECADGYTPDKSKCICPRGNFVDVNDSKKCKPCKGNENPENLRCKYIDSKMSTIPLFRPKYPSL